MKKIVISLLILVWVIYPGSKVLAQGDPSKVREQLKEFMWMEGDWKGDAWYMGRDQVKTPLIQKEHVELKLDGSIITMEGTGYSIPAGSESEKVVFQAFGILTYDQIHSKFIIRAYQGGHFIDSDLVQNTDGSYSWGMELQGGKIRYTLRLTEDGKWKEAGEFSRDGGANWFPTFEMTLSKQK